MDVSFWLTFGAGVALLAFSLVGGIYLYWPSFRRPDGRASLGLALMTGAFLAAIGLLIQLRLDHDQRRRDAIAGKTERRQQVNSERQLFRLNIGLAPSLARADLSGRDLQGIYLNGKRLTGAVLREADLEKANLSSARMARADFTGARLGHAVLICTVLEHATLINAHLEGANLASAHARGAQFPGAVLAGADLSNADLRQADLLGADLRAAKLAGADLRGADLTEARLDVRRLRAVVSNAATTWPDGVRPRTRRLPPADGPTCA